MELKMNWVRVVSVGALAIGIAMLPLSVTAQTKEHSSTKKHKKSSHTKKTHTSQVHHTRKTKKHVAPMEEAVPAVAVKEISSVPPAPSGPIPGKPYDEATWREFHSDWNGQYQFHEGKYYYDPDYKFVAQIPNDFNSIAGRFGGITILDNDPTLIFSGDSGEMYPVLEYNADRYKSDKKYKLKSAFFGRPYFWRDGSRYDRKITVDDKGVRCFQFVKHA